MSGESSNIPPSDRDAGALPGIQICLRVRVGRTILGLGGHACFPVGQWGFERASEHPNVWLVTEEELPGIDDSPEHVFPRLTTIRIFA